ncbi:hypothetical protein QFC22_006157 [Naganishia vaughanmartiniae]|uniref:Uncharacterized protein n=1 Tax=Naganishia vaughanmartiniae TaxID=1424756 RepID=A0ACC2WNN2_9TREE|nr:hypothetical protein QFC22_006157 [Naganishia vaughanmartiniae]
MKPSHHQAPILPSRLAEELLDDIAEEFLDDTIDLNDGSGDSLAQRGKQVHELRVTGLDGMKEDVGNVERGADGTVDTQRMTAAGLEGRDHAVKQRERGYTSNSESTVEESSEVGLVLQERDSLPVELLVLVAAFLAADDCYATLAHLASTCRLVRAETLPVLCETIVLVFDDSVGRSKEGMLSAGKAFLERHGKYVRYIIHYQSFRLPSQVSTPRIQIARSDRIVHNRIHAKEVVDNMTLLITEKVSAPVLDHLIHLACVNVGQEYYADQSGASMKVTEVKVVGSGRVIGRGGTPMWAFSVGANLRYEAGGEGTTEGLEETLRYLHRGFRVFDPARPDPQRFTINVSLAGNVAAVDAFIRSFDELLQRYVFVMPFIRLCARRVSVDEIKERIPALVAVCTKQWARVGPPVAEFFNPPVVCFNLEEGAGSSQRFANDVRLTFKASQAAAAAGQQGNDGSGVTFRLMDDEGTVLYEETNGSLRVPAKAWWREGFVWRIG